MSMDLQTYCVRGAGKLLRVTPDTVRDLIAAGKLVASNVAVSDGKPRWRILAADIEAFLAARRNVEKKLAPRRTPRQATGPFIGLVWVASEGFWEGSGPEPYET